MRNGGIYLAAIGGAGAYYSRSIKSSEVIAFSELLSEAVRLITVDRFPAVVAIDSKGNTINA
jgi:fumarate hydratase subunit beta